MAHDNVSCTAVDDCKRSRELLQMMWLKDMNITRHKTVVEAKIEGLVYCPFCNIPYEIDKCGRISESPTIRLSHPDVILHVFNTRSEVDKKSETVLRRAVEERMKNSVIRERYNICQAGLIKTSECNKVRFTIGYIDSIIFGSMSHFGICAGKPCQSIEGIGKEEIWVIWCGNWASTQKAKTTKSDICNVCIHTELHLRHNLLRDFSIVRV